MKAHSNNFAASPPPKFVVPSSPRRRRSSRESRGSRGSWGSLQGLSSPSPKKPSWRRLPRYKERMSVIESTLAGGSPAGNSPPKDGQQQQKEQKKHLGEVTKDETPPKFRLETPPRCREGTPTGPQVCTPPQGVGLSSSILSPVSIKEHRYTKSGPGRLSAVIESLRSDLLSPDSVSPTASPDTLSPPASPLPSPPASPHSSLPTLPSNPPSPLPMMEAPPPLQQASLPQASSPLPQASPPPVSPPPLPPVSTPPLPPLQPVSTPPLPPLQPVSTPPLPPASPPPLPPPASPPPPPASSPTLLTPTYSQELKRRDSFAISDLSSLSDDESVLEAFNIPREVPKEIVPNEEHYESFQDDASECSLPEELQTPDLKANRSPTKARTPLRSAYKSSLPPAAPSSSRRKGPRSGGNFHHHYQQQQYHLHQFQMLSSSPGLPTRARGGRNVNLSAHSPLRERFAVLSMNQNSTIEIPNSSSSLSSRSARKPIIGNRSRSVPVAANSGNLSLSDSIRTPPTKSFIGSPTASSRRGAGYNSSHRSVVSGVSVASSGFSSHDNFSIPTADAIVVNGRLLEGIPRRELYPSENASRSSKLSVPGRRRRFKKRPSSSFSAANSYTSEASSLQLMLGADDGEVSTKSFRQASVEKELKKRNVVVEEIKYKMGRFVSRPKNLVKKMTLVDGGGGVNGSKVKLRRSTGCLT